MKRYVHAASSKYGIEQFAEVVEYADDVEFSDEPVDGVGSSDKIAELVYDADESGLLEAFATSVSTRQLELVDGMIQHPKDDPNYSAGFIEATFNYKSLRERQILIGAASFGVWSEYKFGHKPESYTPKQLARKLVSEVRKEMIRYYKRYMDHIEKQNLKKTYNKGTTQLVSAFAVACRYVKKYAGLTPTFRYNDSGTAQYMLYKIPGAEIDWDRLDDNVVTKYEHLFRDALAKFADDTSVEPYGIETPHEGSIFRACFEFKVNPKIQLVYDKETDSYFNP